MNNTLFCSTIVSALLIVSCSVADRGWTKEERSIINLDSQVVPVLSIDNEKDAAILRSASTPLSERMLKSDLYGTLAGKMIATVTDPSQDGVGIAGPQIGISRRIVCVQRFDKEGEPFEVYPNIRIISERGEKEYGPEGCLSVPDRRGQVLRSRDIDISYTSIYSLKDTVENVQGFTAVIFQHECDHLDGILYTDRIWADPASWFVPHKAAAEPKEDRADIFYLVSTNIISERDELGDTLYIASLTADQKDVLSREIGYVANHVFKDSLNFFSPFYHQHTLEAINLPQEEFNVLKKQLAKETYEAFNYYMDNLNGGRPFILVGFSQGAMLVKEILKRMTGEQYSGMAAAYILGWGLSKDDLSCPYIRPARTIDDHGVTISYNSVSDTSGIWDAVMDDNFYCINPVNWRTDSTPADFQYNGKTLQVHVDTTHHVLIVNNFEEEPLPFTAPWPEGCLHHYEFIFYADQLRENAILRASKSKQCQ